MAKKRRGKKRQKQRHSSPKRAPYPMRTGEDWKRARPEGGMLVFCEERPLSPVEGEALYEEQLDTIAGRAEEFARGKAEVLDALAPHDAFDLLAALQISSSRVWPKGQNPRPGRVRPSRRHRPRRGKDRAGPTQARRELVCQSL